jgi:predicted nicotinamide N-methyase
MASVFQEVNRGSRDAAEVFFNLANDQRVAYRTASGHLVTVRQDPDVEDSTGGIVWETAYLLATFLEGRPDNGLPAPQSSVLELGAGCGLLGLVLAHNGSNVVCTEATETLSVLKRNIKANQTAVVAAGGSVQAQKLRWEVPKDRAALNGAPYDTIVGTDTVFSVDLVEPMLATAASLSHASTKVWLCFQERCAAAHAELLQLAPHYFDLVEDLSPEMHKAPGCQAAEQLDCWLLCLSGSRTDLPGEGQPKAQTTDTSSSSTSPTPDSSSAAVPTGKPASSSGTAATLSTTAVPAGTAASWMSAAFAASSARAEPDAVVPPTPSDDEDDFDGKAVAAAAARWASEQQKSVMKQKGVELGEDIQTSQPPTVDGSSVRSEGTAQKKRGASVGEPSKGSGSGGGNARKEKKAKEMRKKEKRE